MMLQSESKMDQRWIELVRIWVSFEARSGYEEVKKLSPSNRPTAVSEWIGRARPSTWRPVIKNLPQYEVLFWAWWLDIQPDWRLEDGKLVSERLVGNWEPLQLPGTNGIVSVMVALFYWGLEVLEDAGGQAGWLTAVEECLAAFSQL